MLEKAAISENGGGFNVDCGLLTPPDTARRYPAIVLLGGKATGKYAIDYALDIKDVIIIAPDYPYTPRDRYTLLQFLEDLPAMRQALLDMVPAAFSCVPWNRYATSSVFRPRR